MKAKVISKKKEDTGITNLLKDKPFPVWLKEHTVFRQIKKLDKVFPGIGLPNFEEEVSISWAEDVNASALRLIDLIRRYIVADLQLINNYMYSGTPDKKLQAAYYTINGVLPAINFNSVSIQSNKYSLRLCLDVKERDCNNYVVEKVLFKKEESLFKVLNKLKEIVSEYKINSNIEQLEKSSEFKEFSKLNIPNKKYTLVFSSTGEKGLWDIATISMRGIKSCQTWDTIQSRGLIGTCVSKYTGVMYITSGADFATMGSKMLRRALVRFAINNKNKEPALIIDRMYPDMDRSILDLFKAKLKEKSKVNVFYAQDLQSLGEYYVPAEEHNKFLQPNELSYMDNAINRSKPVPVIPANNFKNEYSAFVSNVIASVNKDLSAELNHFNSFKPKKKKGDKLNLRKMDDLDKMIMGKLFANIEEEKPKEENLPKYEGPLTGGKVNIIRAWKKNHRNCGEVIIRKLIAAVKEPDPREFENQAQYFRACLVGFILNISKNSKELSKQKINDDPAYTEWPKSYKNMITYVSQKTKSEYFKELKKITKVKKKVKK